MKKKFLKLFIFIGLLFIGLGKVNAESGVFTFNIGGAENVKPGDYFTVEVTVKGPDETYTLNGYDMAVSYDVNKLELVEGALDGKISNASANITEDSKLATIKFKVKDGVSAGNTNLKLVLNAILQNGEDVATDTKVVKSNAGTVSVRSIGTDSTLKSLKIPNTVLSPSFDKNVHDYTATVTDVTSVDIKAEPTDSNASIYITENAGALVKGENDITIVCKAENGTETWYGIKVTLNITPTDEELKAQDTTLKSLSIKGQKIDFSSTEKKYYINVDYETTKLNITAVATNPEAEVKITGNSKFVVGKNTVKVNVTSADKSKTDAYQIIVTREEEEKEIVKTCPDSTSKREWIIFTASLVGVFTIGIVLGYILGKNGVIGKIFKKKAKTDEPVEISTLSDTIDLSDTVKQAKKEIKKEDKKEN